MKVPLVQGSFHLGALAGLLVDAVHPVRGGAGLSLPSASRSLDFSLSPSLHHSLVCVTDVPWLILGHFSSLLALDSYLNPQLPLLRS